MFDKMRLLTQNSLRYRRQILALKHFFAGRKCTVLLLDDLSSHAEDLQLHSITHGVIALEQLALDYGAERRRLRVTTLFEQAARVVLLRPASWERHGLKTRIEAAAKRLHHNVLAIALANKLARIAWSVLHHGRTFEVRKMSEPASQSA